MIPSLQEFLSKHLRPQTSDLRPLLVLYGPTASGKSKLAIEIAKEFDGEIISADSRMLYQGTRIGTDIPTIEEMQGIPHHLLDFVPPEKEYTLKEYQEDAYRVIKDILKRAKLPILVGGTNLYIDAVTDGYEINSEIRNQKSEIHLENMSTKDQFELLEKLDPETAAKVDPHNPRHFIRKLEFCLATGEKYSTKDNKKAPDFFTPLKIGIELDRETMYTRIEKRVHKEIDDGLIEETRELLKKYPQNHIVFSSLGYRQIIPYLKGKYNYEAMVAQLKQDTRNFGKRQLTWLRKKKDVEFFDNPQ